MWPIMLCSELGSILQTNIVVIKGSFLRVI